MKLEFTVRDSNRARAREPSLKSVFTVDIITKTNTTVKKKTHIKNPHILNTLRAKRIERNSIEKQNNNKIMKL